MRGGFVVPLPKATSDLFTYAEDTEAFKRLKKFSGMPLSLSSLDDLPLVVFGDEAKKVNKGLSFHFRGASPFPEFCPTMEATFNAQALTAIKMSAFCKLDKKHAFTSVPSLKSIKMTEISVDADLSVAELAFQLGTKLQIATGDSMCAAPTAT